MPPEVKSAFEMWQRGRQGLEARRFSLLLPVLMFVSVALLGLSRLDHPLVRDTRWRLAELMAPVLDMAMGPFSSLKWAGQHVTDHFNLVDELDRLRTENQKLRGWEWRSKELERKLADLSAVARVVETQSIPFVTVRVVANSSGAFVRSVMIDAGVEQGLKSGYATLNGDGLVGRVVETGNSRARVLLLTDQMSRIPVHIGDKAINAIVAGDNGPMPRIISIASEEPLRPGDEVSTSGAGGLFPRGLRIGVVEGEAGRFRVKLHARLDTIEFLSVLFHETPAIELINGPAAALKGSDARAALGAGGRLRAGEGRAP